MDPLRLAIACVPLAAYLFLLGVINVRRQPLLTTGAADLATLGAALTGFAFVGPIELFRPSAATGELGDYIWLFLLAFYWLWVGLAVLVTRPRLVVYNVSLEELRPVVADAVSQVDSQARWAGDNLSLPSLGVQLHLDTFGIMRNTSLVSTGGNQNLEGWRRLRKALQRSLKSLEVKPNPRSVSFFIAATGLLLAALVGLARNPMEVAQAIGDILAF